MGGAITLDNGHRQFSGKAVPYVRSRSYRTDGIAFPIQVLCNTGDVSPKTCSRPFDRNITNLYDDNKQEY